MTAMRIPRQRVLWLGVLMTSLFLATAIAVGAPPAKDPVVEAADPSSAQQETTLDVEISGKNFAKGAKATFFITGTDDDGDVEVISTTYLNPKKLRANVKIPLTAIVADYDIEIELLSGRKGRGTERVFSVLKKGNNEGGEGEIQLCVRFRNAVGDLFRSDLLSTPEYCHGEAPKLIARIGNVNGLFNLYISKTPREVTLDLGSSECSRLKIGENCSTEAALNTLNEWEDLGMGLESFGVKLDLSTIEVGDTAYVDFQVSFPSRSKSTPNQIVFGRSNHPPLCGNPLPVSRVDADTWTIEASTELACLVEVGAGNKQFISREGFPLPFLITLKRQ